ncbi:2-amino-4-hydroxy-6-hydroxymethyldihydropteridine diphosphokinase [Microbacterium sp. NPDC076911]|uniref:2-amino-4-hydroxy-6- hydroxymethyldihydropteridine diphosphokinase n=1 Tax=Microbacterium sp. NPDC076911 TaxID=3154958 RepID=UPI00342C941A
MSRRLAEGIGATPGRDAYPTITAVVALGANLGDRDDTMRTALEDLARLPLVSHVHASAPIESVALKLDGPDDAAPAYLNSVALVQTRLAPTVLLAYLHAIENRHGRERRERWGDRTLDLDLIAYGEVTSDDPALVIPHPRAAQREFVLAPWLGLDRDAVLPGHGRVDEILKQLRQEK